MTEFVVEIDPDIAEAQQDARNGGGDGKFPPVPKGRYQAFIEKFEKIEDFGGQGANAKKKVAKIRVKVLAESPTAAGRVYFVRIPLFSRFAPNEKHPKGAPASNYFAFFEDVMGVPAEQVAAGKVGSLEAVGGQHLTITLGAPKAPDQWNPLGSNEVDFVGKAGNIAETPKTKVMVPWLDNDGNLAEGFAAGPAQGSPVQQQPAQAPQWGGQQQSQPAQAPQWGGQQAAAQPVAGAAAQQQSVAGAPAWTPAQADIQHAAAAATGY